MHGVPSTLAWHFARACARHGYKNSGDSRGPSCSAVLFAVLRDGIDFSVTRAGVEQGDCERTANYK